MIRFVNPNYHVILIHYPLGLLGIGLLIELFAFLWPRSTFRIAGRWMILLGALGTVPASVSGIFAKWDIVKDMAGGNEGHWEDLKLHAGLSGLQWQFLNQHVLYNAIASVLAVLAVVLWLGGSDRWRRGLHIPVLLMLLVSMGLMVTGAYNGGEMVYRTRFATRDEQTSTPMEQDALSDIKTSTGREKVNAQLNYYVDPLQAHVIGAGFLFALCAASLGMSLRKSSQVRLVTVSGPVDGAGRRRHDGGTADHDRRRAVAVARGADDRAAGGRPAGDRAAAGRDAGRHGAGAVAGVAVLADRHAPGSGDAGGRVVRHVVRSGRRAADRREDHLHAADLEPL